ncbi:MAG: type II and III secretion system protein [Gammaproteobacteria bacterium]|nr:type II and III secretion system protein [Gammaproteobacteria bacterium]
MKFRCRVFGSSLLLTLLVGCAAERLHQEGLAAIERGDYETGIADLRQALAKAPDNMGYRLDFPAQRDAAVHTLIAQADTARQAGQLEGAAALYRRVLTIEPSNYRARHGLDGIEGDKRHAEMLDTARKAYERKDYDASEAQLRAILSEDPGYVPAEELAAAINLARGPVTAAPKLQTRENRRVTLQLRDAPTKMVFEVLQRETGVNFILDKDIKSDSKTSIFVQDVPVEEAIDLVLEQNQLARQILATNMVIIYPNTPAKQKDYEQQIVRTFYLTNATPKDVESMLKTVLGTKTLFIDERANVVVMRDTPDAVRMAEKLVASVDVTEPEVMLEVEVLEITRSRLLDLGIQYPSSVTLTPSALAHAATGGATTAGSGLVLSDLSHQNSHTINVSNLGITVNALKQAGLVNTLASPRIRARNKEKAKILIGTREPVITNSVTPTAVGAPVVTGSVQYLDVGLTLEVQPTVYLDNDVAIKVNLEVSSILKQVTTQSGTIAYEVGTRNANTLLQLKDGETQVLAGLIQDSDTRNFNGIPGLGDIPILKHLFGTQHSDREKDEIVLSITPRIVRLQPRAAGEATEFWYGNESRTRTAPYTSVTAPPSSRAAPPAQSAGSAAVSAPAQVYPPPGAAALPNSGGPQPVNPSVPAATVSAPLGGSEVPQGPPITAVPAPIAPVPAPPSAAGESAANAASSTGAAPASQPGGAGAPSALSVQGPSEAKVGDEFDVIVQLSSSEPITRLRSQLRFDATALQLMNASTGEIVPAAAGSPTISTRGAGAQLDVTTTSEEPVQGSGPLMLLHFKALTARPATHVSAMLNVLSGTGAAVGSSAAQPLQIAIQP